MKASQSGASVEKRLPHDQHLIFSGATSTMMALMVEVASVVVTLVVLLVVVVVLLVVVVVLLVVVVVLLVVVVVVLVVVVGVGVVVLGVTVVLLVVVVVLVVVVGISVVVDVKNVVGGMVVILGHRCWLHFLLILFPPGHALPAPLSLTSSLRVLVCSPPSQD